MTPNITNPSALSTRDANALKGLALLLLLWHHLFFAPNRLFDDLHIIKNVYLAQELGAFCKLCVVMFVFLSGYGLMAQAEIKKGISNLRDWYIRRFKKLILNYWTIWIVFVPISALCFGITFQDAYQSDIGLHLIADLLGIHSLLYHDILCYNPTWWFYSCIIVLYLLFPLMYKMMKKDALSLILLTLIMSFLPIPFIDVIKFNIVAFSLGMWMAKMKNTPPIHGNGSWIVAVLLLLYAVERNINSYPLMIDCIIALLIVRLYQAVKCPDIFKNVMAFLGKHSMNIFLFHTFIFYFWFQDFVYSSRNPIIIFLTLLTICLPISIALEWIKKYTIYKL